MAKHEKSVSLMYARGDEVHYQDHFGRTIFGTILGAEARWPGYGKRGDAPFVSYRITHPTYRNRQMEVGEDAILTSATAPGYAKRS